MDHSIYGKRLGHIAVCGVCAMLAACGHADNDELGHHHDHGEAHEMESEIHLPEDMAERFGVSADTILPGVFHEIVETTGEVLNAPGSTSVVTAPTAGVVRFAKSMQLGAKVSAGTTLASVSAAGISGGDRNSADRAALDAAQRELDRINPLYQEGIVSQKDYNAALAALQAAQSQYSAAAASGAAKAVGSGVITGILVDNGQYVEAGTPIATVGSATRLTLRADVPERYYSQIARLNGGSYSTAYSPDVYSLADNNARRVSPPQASMRQQPGYIPVYFEMDNNGATLPGSMVYVYLQGDQRHGVISVPRQAVSEQQGKYYVYRQIDEDCYEKLPVTLGATDGSRVEVTSGLSGGECIVTSGTSAVRLAETSAVAPEGHSHSH